MTEICLPIPEMRGGQILDISVVTSQDVNLYRVEIFECSSRNRDNENPDDSVFSVLKSKIEHYDKTWQLLQVFAPEGEKKEVKVLFRKR